VCDDHMWAEIISFVIIDMPC